MTMRRVERVYLIGLGALGGMYAARLYESRAVELKVIAGGARGEAYRRSGIWVNGKEFAFDVIAPGSGGPAADLIVIAVKNPQLQQAVADLHDFVGPDTVVISLLNGISSEELVGGIIGPEHVLYAYGVGMDAVREGGAIRYSNMGRIVFGERENRVVSPRVGAVRTLFERAGIPYVIPQDMIRALWSKFMLNVGINQASAVLRAPYASFQRDREARELMVMAASEVVAISKRNGIDLGEEDVTEFLRIIDGLDPSGKTSMLQDVEAGRKTEVDLYSGRVIELGVQFGVPTPVNEVFFKIISVMERSSVPPAGR